MFSLNWGPTMQCSCGCRPQGSVIVDLYACTNSGCHALLWDVLIFLKKVVAPSSCRELHKFLSSWTSKFSFKAQKELHPTSLSSNLNNTFWQPHQTCTTQSMEIPRPQTQSMVAPNPWLSQNKLWHNYPLIPLSLWHHWHQLRWIHILCFHHIRSLL